MALDRTVVTIVLATDHAHRDEWVDTEAVKSSNDVPISDETYCGVWLAPYPERTEVHVFSEAGPNRLQSFGFVYLRGGR